MSVKEMSNGELVRAGTFEASHELDNRVIEEQMKLKKLTDEQLILRLLYRLCQPERFQTEYRAERDEAHTRSCHDYNDH